MSYHKSVKDVLKNSSAYLAIGQSEIYLDDEDPDLPWSDVSHVEASCGYRLNGPTGFYAVARKDGLTLKWSVDFEKREANGKGYSLFDRDRLRSVMQKLPAGARRRLADLLEQKVLPGVEKVTAEWRDALNNQLDSEDCVRGLISFARS